MARWLVPSVAPARTGMTQDGSLQEAPRSLKGRLPIKAGRLGLSEKAGLGGVGHPVLGGGQQPEALVC